MNPITALLAALGGLTVVFVGGWTTSGHGGAAGAGRHRLPGDGRAVPLGAADSASARSPTSSTRSASARSRRRRRSSACAKLVPDRIIPGTLNAGHTLPTIAQAFIYTAVIPVDVVTLFSMIAAAVLGAWLGAGVVSNWPKRTVQIGMGAALLVAATLMLITQLQALTGPRSCRSAASALGVQRCRCSSSPWSATSCSAR